MLSRGASVGSLIVSFTLFSVRYIMDNTFHETIEQLQKQIAEIGMRLQAVATKLSKLIEEDESSEYQQLIGMQGDGQSLTGRDSIREKSVVCLECGRVCRVLTKRHLSLHGLTPDMYRLKWEIGQNTPLMCLELLNLRKSRMNDMKLWIRGRKQKKVTP